jgi:hypothetical protein
MTLVITKILEESHGGLEEILVHKTAITIPDCTTKYLRCDPFSMKETKQLQKTGCTWA